MPCFAHKNIPHEMKNSFKKKIISHGVDFPYHSYKLFFRRLKQNTEMKRNRKKCQVWGGKMLCGYVSKRDFFLFTGKRFIRKSGTKKMGHNNN